METKQIDKKFRAFYGTTTMGEKGQAVIPAEARKAMNLEKGDKLLVFGFGNDIVAFSKAEGLEKIAEKLAGRLEEIKGIIEKAK